MLGTNDTEFLLFLVDFQIIFSEFSFSHPCCPAPEAEVTTDDLISKTRQGRNQHSLAFQIPSPNKDVYKNSFFPQTIRDWNDLPNP